MNCLTTSVNIKQEVITEVMEFPFAFKIFLKLKERSDLSINNKDIVSLTLEILSGKTPSVLVNVL